MERIEGLIISAQKRGESDIQFSVITKNCGKLNCVARGIFKGDSKLRSILQIGHQIDALILPLRSGYYRIASPSLLSSHMDIRNNPAKLEACLFSFSFLNEIILEGSPDVPLWEFLLQWLKQLRGLSWEASINQKKLRLWFLFQLAHTLGFAGRELDGYKNLSLDKFVMDGRCQLNEQAIQSLYASSLGYQKALSMSLG